MGDGFDVKEEIDRKLIKGLIGGQRAQFGWGEFDPLTANSIWIGKGKHIKNYTFLHTVGIDASQQRLPTPIGGSGDGGHPRKEVGGRGDRPGSGGKSSTAAVMLPAAPCCRAPSPGSVPPHSVPLLLSLPWARPELWLAGGEASAEQGRGGGLERGRGAAAVPSGTTKAWRRP